MAPKFTAFTAVCNGCSKKVGPMKWQHLCTDRVICVYTLLLPHLLMGIMKVFIFGLFCTDSIHQDKCDPLLNPTDK